MNTPELIAEFLRLVVREAQAEAGAVLFYMEPPESQPLLLTHQGSGAAVPELASEASAWTLIRQHRDMNYPEQPLVQTVTSKDQDCVLMRIALDSILVRPKNARRDTNERRADPNIDTAPSIDGTVWIGLRGAQNAAEVVERLQQGVLAGETASLEQGWLTGLAAKLAWSVYQLSGALQDPISQLPGRMEFQVFFKRALAASITNRKAISLMFVNPDDFSMINHRYGREHGDLAVREIGEALATCLRQTDGVFRYAGAVFAVVLPATNAEQCTAAAEKVRSFISRRAYINDAERLTFSIGAVVATPAHFDERLVEVTDLLRQADTALNRAKLSGGARVVQHDVDTQAEGPDAVNPLSGLFTADTEKDYRNMLLLWETVGLVSVNPEPAAMAAALADRLAIGFQPDRLVILCQEVSGVMMPLASNVRDETAFTGRAAGRLVKLDEAQDELVRSALESKQVERLRSKPDEQSSGFTAYAVPLVARDHVIGCMYLDGSGRRLQLDSSDVIFLNALASQMGVALDRAQLAAGWIREKDRESRLLREELAELKQVAHQQPLIFQSSEMSSLMDTLRRVAPSEATVLITGESGTGKEMLAQATHEHSDRRDKPFVVFDCGAVAVNLIEAELFGHVKGAFTGAESASDGCIARSDGGTLFLDEIGELPLQVQAKLLRFVQEKTFTPVGSNASRKVDVRIVAATNRRLQDEVARGNFRSDLYYRLQVISLQAIPLRHRKADILPLAQHFIEKLSLQNSMSPKALSHDAERKLMDYDWPGNVRELQHCMLRAVLTADAEVVNAAGIEFMPESTPQESVHPTLDPHLQRPRLVESDDGIDALRAHQSADDETIGEAAQHDDQSADRWAALRAELLHQIELALQQNRSRPVPLGRWLTEDLVLAANSASDQVSRRAAALVGVPESTFRRHYNKASADQAAGLMTRTTSWDRVRPLLAEVVQTAQAAEDDEDVDLIDQARLVLLEDVLEQVDNKVSVGAALMGVTPPTYKRWLQQREAS